MLTFVSFDFWANFVIFIVAIFIAFYVPGFLLLKNLKLSCFEKTVLSLIVGMVFFTWQGFIVGSLGIRWVTYLYLFLTSFYWLKLLFSKTINFPKKNIFKLYCLNLDPWLIGILLGGILVQLISILLVGIKYWDGIYFCCSLPDSLYHIALTNQLVNQYPPIEPGASGIIVNNYHYWANLMIAELVRVFQLPLITTQYQYFVFLFSLLFGLTAVVFAQIEGISKIYQRWLLLFLYFSGDITFILLFILGKGLNFSLPFLENGTWLWISPPRVIGATIFLGGISLLSLWLKEKSYLLGFLLVFIFSSLIGFKVYIGIFALIGFAFLGLFFLFLKNWKMLLPVFLTEIIGLLVYFSVARNAGGLIFTGMWRFENFIVSPVLNLSYLELARQIYLVHNNIPRLIQYNLIYIVVYFFFVFGTLIVGLLQNKKSLSHLSLGINIFLISGIIVSTILGSFFVQKTGGANSSQFLITVEIILSIYSALACYYWLRKIKLSFKYLLISLIVILTSVRIIHASFQSLQAINNRAGFFVKNDELSALDYLKNNTNKNSIVLVDNIDKNHWRNAFSYYISFLSNRQIFLDGIGIALDHGVAVEEKIQDATNIFNNPDINIVKRILTKNHIDYLYLDSKGNLASTQSANLLTEVFKNDQIKILKVKDK